MSLYLRINGACGDIKQGGHAELCECGAMREVGRPHGFRVQEQPPAVPPGPRGSMYVQLGDGPLSYVDSKGETIVFRQGTVVAQVIKEPERGYRNRVDAEPLRAFIAWMRALPTDEARLEAICALHERFHEACGCTLKPGEHCQCDNDE